MQAAVTQPSANARFLTLRACRCNPFFMDKKMTNEQKKRYSTALHHAHILPMLHTKEAIKHRSKLCLAALRVALDAAPKIYINGRWL